MQLEDDARAVNVSEIKVTSSHFGFKYQIFTLNIRIFTLKIVFKTRYHLSNLILFIFQLKWGFSFQMNALDRKGQNR